MSKVGAIVLAAGRSSRYRAGGGKEETKLIAEIGGRPIVRRVAEAALASRARPVVVVVGHASGAIESSLAGVAADIAFNPDFATGLASSLRTGLQAMPSDAAGAVVLLGDMPYVDSELIERLIDAYEAAPAAFAVAPLAEGRRGNPVLIGRALFESAMRLAGDQGARRLLSALPPEKVIDVVVAGEDAVFDVDTPDDLAAAGRHRPPVFTGGSI